MENELLDMRRKPIYELTTESGKSINTTAEHPYLVKLYSEEDCKKHEGNVWNKEYNKFDGKSCERWVSVSELEEGEGIAVQKLDDEKDNKVYPSRLGGYSTLKTFFVPQVLIQNELSRLGQGTDDKNEIIYLNFSSYNNQISFPKNILSKSSVVNTGTSDCSLKCGSLDQIAELVDNASARKSISSESDIKVLAFLRNLSYANPLKNSTDSSISFCLISNSCSESLDLDKIISLYLSNSDFMNSGAINSALIEKNKYAETELGFMIENKELLSNTNLILVYLYSSLSLGDMELSNSSLIFGEISESNLLNRPFLASLPSSTDHLINSCSSLECNLFNNCSACLLRSDNTVLINSDQFTQENSDISNFNSSSTAKVIDAIYIFPLAFNSSNFLSSLTLSDTALRATAATFTSGNSFLNFINNSSGTDTVTLGILVNSSIYLDTSKYVRLFKPFDPDDFYFDKIVSIKRYESQQVYDLAIEGTPEYQMSLVLDTVLNIERMKNENL
ncbi:MAG: hypothetical protein V1788_03250 [Nanoarchaeota archaeon]